MTYKTKIWGARKDLDALGKYLKARGLKCNKYEALKASHDPSGYCLICVRREPFTQHLRDWLILKDKQMMTRESYGPQDTIKGYWPATKIDEALRRSVGFNLGKSKRKKPAIKIAVPRKAFPPAIESPREKSRRKRKGAATTEEIIGKQQSPTATTTLAPLSDGTFEVASEHVMPEPVHIADAPTGAKPYVHAEPPPPKLLSFGGKLPGFRRRRFKQKRKVRIPKVDPKIIQDHLQK